MAPLFRAHACAAGQYHSSRHGGCVQAYESRIRVHAAANNRATITTTPGSALCHSLSLARARLQRRGVNCAAKPDDGNDSTSNQQNPPPPPAASAPAGAAAVIGDKAKAPAPHHLPVSAFMPPPARQLLHQLADCVLIFNVQEADEAAGAADSEPGGEAAAASSLTSQQAVQAHASILAAGSLVLARLLQEQLPRQQPHPSAQQPGGYCDTQSLLGADVDRFTTTGGASDSGSIEKAPAAPLVVRVPGVWTAEEFEGAQRALALITVGSMEVVHPLACKPALPPPPSPAVSQAAGAAGLIMPPDVPGMLAVLKAAQRLRIWPSMHAAAQALSTLCSSSARDASAGTGSTSNSGGGAVYNDSNNTGERCSGAAVRSVRDAVLIASSTGLLNLLPAKYRSHSPAPAAEAGTSGTCSSIMLGYLAAVHGMNMAAATDAARTACCLALLSRFPAANIILNSEELKEEFAQLPLSAVYALLKDSSPFATDSENSVLALVCFWVHHNADAVACKPATVATLRECVRVSQLTDEYLFSVLPRISWFALTAREGTAFSINRPQEYGKKAEAAGLPRAWFYPMRPAANTSSSNLEVQVPQRPAANAGHELPLSLYEQNATAFSYGYDVCLGVTGEKRSVGSPLIKLAVTPPQYVLPPALCAGTYWKLSSNSRITHASRTGTGSSWLLRDMAAFGAPPFSCGTPDQSPYHYRLVYDPFEGVVHAIRFVPSS